MLSSRPTDTSNLVGDQAIVHFAVGRLDEAVLVHARMRGQRGDQTDVRALRRLNRANTAVVRRVHVAHFEAGSLAGQTARTKRADRRRLWVISLTAGWSGP
jgi:hypothetical protein